MTAQQVSASRLLWGFLCLVVVLGVSACIRESGSISPIVTTTTVAGVTVKIVDSEGPVSTHGGTDDTFTLVFGEVQATIGAAVDGRRELRIGGVAYGSVEHGDVVEIDADRRVRINGALRASEPTDP